MRKHKGRYNAPFAMGNKRYYLAESLYGIGAGWSHDLEAQPVIITLANTIANTIPVILLIVQLLLFTIVEW